MMDPQQAMVPETVIRFFIDSLHKGDLIPEAKRDKIYRLAIELRDGSPDALHLAEMFDRGEIDENQLIGINLPTELRVPDSVLRLIDKHISQLEAYSHHSPIDLIGEIDLELYRSSKRKLFHFVMKLANGSPTAMRACEQFDRGEIDGNRLLEMA